MQILAIEKELTEIDPRKMHGLLREEAACVWALKKQEIIRDIWFTCAGKHAVIMLECASEEDAKQHLGSLPLVRQRIIEFDVQALRTYDGFERLLETRK